MYTIKLNVTKKEYGEWLKAAKRNNAKTIEEYIQKTLKGNIKVKFIIAKAVKKVKSAHKFLAQIFR